MMYRFYQITVIVQRHYYSIGCIVARNDSNIGIRYRLINDIFHAVSSLRKNYYAYSDGPFCDSYAPQMQRFYRTRWGRILVPYLYNNVHV